MTPAQLDLLSVLARRKKDAALSRLAAAVRQQSAERAKLDTLLQLRAEYQARFSGEIQAGMGKASADNFQAFLERLKAAVYLFTANAFEFYARLGWEKTGIVEPTRRANLLLSKITA